MTPTEKIKEIEKGCGKKIFDIESQEEYFCSDFNGLCDICQAKLSILKEWEAEDKRRFEELKEKMWGHPKTFEGIKCKTCLPLDYVEDIIDEIYSLQEDGK